MIPLQYVKTFEDSYASIDFKLNDYLKAHPTQKITSMLEIHSMHNSHKIIVVFEEQRTEQESRGHAHWKVTQDLAGNYYAICSNCDTNWWLDGESPADADMNFCPSCGFIMDEEEH